MLITCPNCEASYTVADTALGEKGRSVRCAKCKQVWHAVPPVPEPVVEEWQPSVDEWKPAADEWKPSTEEWQPTIDQPPAEAAAPAGDAAWPQQETTVPPHVDDAPPVVPAQSAEGTIEAAPSDSADTLYAEVRRRKVARRQARKERGLGITATHVAAALAGIVIALFFAREGIVRLFPQAASLYSLLGFNVNVRGLEFVDLKTSYETQDGTRVLFVEGDIRNISGTRQPVANLRFSMRNAAGVEVYGWTGVPDRNMTPPGETTHFRTRLASPPSDGRDVRVSFAPMSREAAEAAIAPSVPAKH